ncbi:hypothetical protein [Caballeronia sp. S22]
MTWLVALALLDIGLLLVFAFPAVVGAAPLTQLMAARAALMMVLPVAVLLLSGLVPSNVKAMLVYWKRRNAHPGHVAFSRYGPADPRVDMAALRKNVGALPEEPGRAERVLVQALPARRSGDFSGGRAQDVSAVARRVGTLAAPCYCRAASASVRRGEWEGGRDRLCDLCRTVSPDSARCTTRRHAVCVQRARYSVDQAHHDMYEGHFASHVEYVICIGGAVAIGYRSILLFLTLEAIGACGGKFKVK